MWDVQSALGFRVSVLRDSGSLSLSLFGGCAELYFLIFLSVWRHLLFDSLHMYLCKTMTNFPNPCKSVVFFLLLEKWVGCRCWG